ncbi:MAG TPA: transcription termination/antitermination NusG family protein [Castellaniella sp.]|uniref:transcription termination/antitermination protein NusG n=1 Tax=Castellaniella sp. TaxID=1955812 RepID=UPI002F1318D3
MTSAGPATPTASTQAVTTLWYVAHTKPRAEHIAQEQLQRQDFEVYLPLFRVFKKPTRRGAARQPVSSPAVQQDLARASARATPPVESGVVDVIHEPMFPRYLFLRPTRATQSLSVVRSTLGVSRLVMFGQQPATLANAAVQGIRQAEGLREAAPLDKISPYAPGMAVQLLDPAFSGVQALVQAVSKDRVTLLLEILGKPQSVQVEFARVAPV